MTLQIRRLIYPLLTVAYCAACSTYTSSAVEDVGPRLSRTEGFVSVGDSLQLYYRTMGSGSDTVVVVHGGPGYDQNSLEADLEPMVAGRTLVFYDQRGTGRSTVTNDPAELTATHFVSDLEALRHHLGISRMTLMGQGWGAGLAALYAREHPDLVKRLVLIDPIPMRRAPYFTQFHANYASRLGQKPSETGPVFVPDPDATDSALSAACGTQVARLLRGYYADSSSIGRSRSKWCQSPPPALRNQIEVNHAILASLDDWDWRGVFQHMSLPVLVFRGARDPTPAEAAREWAVAFPNAKVLTIQGSGAFPFVEQPGQFFPFVNLFLRGDWPLWAK